MIETFSGLLTPMIAVTTALILYWQFRLEKNRWRLALWDKRYPVFEATRQYLSFIIINANITQEELYKFQRNSKDKEFLFGRDIREYLNELYNKGNDLIYHTRQIEALEKKDNKEEKRLRLIDEQTELMAWFLKQVEESKKLFGEYLTIDKK